MKRRALRAALAGLLCAGAAAPEPPDAGPSAVAVLDAKVAGVEASTGAAVTQALAAHAANELGLAVVSMEDVRRVLAFEQTRQALGCDAEACDAAPKLGAALGAGTLVAPSLNRAGGRVLLALAVIDAATARATGRATRELSREDEAPGAARELLHKLLGGGAERPRSAARLAVLYFDNGGGTALDPLRKGLADMLVTDLSRVEGVTVVERARLEALLAELKLQSSRAFDPAAAQRLGRLLGAQYVVVGGFFELMGSLRLDARVVAVETGEVAKAAGVAGKVDEFLALEQKLAAELAAGLPGRLAPSESVPREEAPAFQDVLEYAKALELMDAGRTKEARARAAKLAAARPRFAAAVALARRLGAGP